MEMSSSSFAMFSFFLLTITYCLGLKSPLLCHKEERSVLLQFKQSFALNLSDSTCPGTSPKLASWKIEGPNGKNCCLWDGVECDRDTGYVIGLNLSRSCLHGSIDSNSSLFQLVHLRNLYLSYNNFKQSEIPKAIGQLLELRHLDLSESQFSGQIPYAISKLQSLSILKLSTDVSSEKPLLKLTNPDLRTLILNLTNLECLSLDYIDISSAIPDFLTNFTSLKILSMRDCGLQGNFPENIFQLQNLKHITLVDNPNLYGYFPDFNSSNSLKRLWVPGTSFYGKIPFSIGNLLSLHSLVISGCNFFGSIPSSLGNLTELQILAIFGNKFSGPIPSSLGNLLKLNMLDLQENDFNDATRLPWLAKLSKLGFLTLSAMNLSGNVLSSIQNLSSLIVFSMDHNLMGSKLPKWLGNFSSSLVFLSLKGNMFSGSIPDSFGLFPSNLKFIDLSENQLHGRVPKSLSNCEMLEVIVLNNNLLNDVFPAWLGTLPNLGVLVLHSNRFHGTIGEPKTNLEFSKLHIIDLSHNSFSGNLPLMYISNWNAMKTFSNDSTYISINGSTKGKNVVVDFHIFYSITIIHKGSQRKFSKILGPFSVIDLSCNRFEGQISYSIGNLQGLHSLNLSNNKFMGQVPSSLGNMQQLEVLDLSNNMFSGNIPQQLSQLTFLEIFNVSYNNFSGQIPEGKQLNTMDNSSYKGNPYLCGKPLLNKCQDFGVKQVPFSRPREEYDQMSFSKFGWQIVLIGYGCGVVFGIVLGNRVFMQKQDWLLKTFGVTPKREQSHGSRMRH